MNSAVRRYLLFTIPDGANVGLVKYSSSAHNITTGLVNVVNRTVRETLADLVPLEYSGATAIGKGLILAQRVSIGSLSHRLISYYMIYYI